MPGTLFVVATPIGNLEDVSFRALRTLKEVSLIVAEDTRRTAKLLAHFEIRTPVTSLHAHNEYRSVPGLIARLQAGESIALVSDAGTPAIADPGEQLVRAAHEHGLRVSAIPGPSAITAALSASGFPASEFVFLGFVPRSGADRRRWLEGLVAEPRTMVFFETPHRIERTVAELRHLFGNRPIMIHREITKIHEEYIIRPNMEPVRPQGEFVLVVAPSSRQAIGQHQTQPSQELLDTAFSMLHCLVDRDQFDRTTAIDLASRALGIEKRALAKAFKKHIILVKQQNKAVP